MSGARVRIETKSGDVHLCTGALLHEVAAPVAAIELPVPSRPFSRGEARTPAMTAAA